MAGVAQDLGLYLIEPSASRSNKKQAKKALEAYHIAAPVRDLIADEFRVVKSSRRLARKYKLPLHVVQDILHLAIRKGSGMESSSVRSPLPVLSVARRTA